MEMVASTMTDTEKIFQELGLSEGETKVYLALLKLGPSNVHKIKEEANIHRTTVYDFVDKLIYKGLVSYVMKNGIRHYKANDVSKLNDYVQEKGEKLKQILPDLQKLQSFIKEDFSVEVHQGREGFKYWLNLVLREGKDVSGIGIEEAEFDDKYHYELESFFKKEKEIGITEKLISRKGTKFVYPYKHLEYRYLPEEFFSPMGIIIFSEYVAIQNFHNDSTIIIKSKSIADAYRKQFSHLWGIAESRS